MTPIDALNDYLRLRNCRFRDGNSIVDVRYEAVSINDDAVTYTETWRRWPNEVARDREALPESFCPFSWIIPPSDKE